MEMNPTRKRSQVALLQSPGIGHLIPLIELARRLALNYDFCVTLLIPALDAHPRPQECILANLPAYVKHIILPPIESKHIPEGTCGEARVSLVILHSLPYVRKAFETNNFDSLVVDIFGTDAFDVAKDFNVSCFLFYLGNALSLSLFWHLPELDEVVECDLRDLGGPLKLPGCVPIQDKDLINSFKEKASDSYKWILHHTKRYRFAQGIIVNSFKDLEPGPIKALQEPGKPPLYPIGPLIRNGSNEPSDCLTWLDRQPDKSVLYISFGSGGTLNHDQFTELAHGLELSQQRFLWVLKSPNDIPSAEYFTAESSSDPLTFLPDGFLERTRGMGLAVTSWTPQAQILGHIAVGGFFTHCGWNSILEGIVYSVPFIAWPLYAEQKMNAAMLTDDLKIALRPEANEDGLVEHGEIARVVKQLMGDREGRSPIQDKIKEMKNIADKALGVNGDSTKTISELACKLKSREKI